MKRIDEEIGRLQESWPDAIVLGETEASMYDSFPYLFIDVFPPVDEERLHHLALASRLYATSILIHDKIYDEGRDAVARRAPVNALRIQALQWEAYRQLHGIFAPDSPFWDDFGRYVADFAQACVEEQRFVLGERPWCELSEELAIAVARGKCGIARAAVAGLAELSGDRTNLGTVEDAVGAFDVASQLFDDLCDWQEDLESGTPSLLLARVLPDRPAHADRADSEFAADVGRRIYYGGHAAHVIDLAVGALDRALASTAAWPSMKWRAVVEELRERCLLFAGNLERIVGENVARIATQQRVELALPAPVDDWQDIAWKALRYIAGQWHLGFGEARHIMEFAPALGLHGPQHQRGDIFQRALIADALCDADAALGGIVRPIIDQEVAYLLSRRDPGRAGWRYFPELPELPPDADDLAQIMQVLWRSGHRRELREQCEEPLSIVFDDVSHADGSFETWIIPSTDRTDAEMRQAECARTMWGTGSDTEVVANLLYALAIVDPKRYAERLDRGATFLEACQRDDGGWNSTWYHGPFYGTYVCLRLLSRVRPGSDAVRRAAAMLRAARNSDGGWGEDGASTALETSLALLGLAAVDAAGAGTSEDALLASRALDRLRSEGRDDGSWPAGDFIRMEVGRATGGPTYVVSHGSRTLTTTFVMKAALAWHAQCLSAATAHRTLRASCEPRS
jgi:squalene-hopene/tetraprenyl-beta-curcumene cyclase